MTYWPAGRALLPALCAVGLVGCFSASCSGEIDDRATNRQSDNVRVIGNDFSSAIDRMLDTAVGYAIPEGPVRWPEDSFPHPSYRAESWQLMAWLQDEDGIRYSVLQQLDRIGLRDADVLDSNEQISAWQFRDVMRGSLHLLSEAEPRRDWQSVQRVALGLASAAGPAENPTSTQLNVGGNRLDIHVTQKSEVEASEAQERCPMRFVMSNPETLRLEFNQQQCAESNESGPLRITTSTSLLVEGEISPGRSVKGTGWLRHAFGEIPGSRSPVVFDNALIEIEGIGLLVISRSKRRSGRGPATLEVHLHNQPSAHFDDLIWSGDELEADAQPIVPEWRLQSAFNKLDITLEPVSTDAWVAGAQGAIWRGAVSVTGSHEGVGFVDFQSVSSNAASK